MSYLPMRAPAPSPSIRRIDGPVRVLLAWTIRTALALSTGCLLPLAPDFQDPPKAPNYSPSFQVVTPFAETLVSPGSDPFHIEIDEPNPQDTLYVRWVADYPPYTPGKTKQLSDMILLPGQDRATDFKLPSAAPCSAFSSGADHRLVVIVSDRPFRSADQFTDPFRYSLVEGGGTPIMIGWTITGCP